MNKTDLIDAIASSADISSFRRKSTRRGNRYISSSLAKGDSVSLVGFGTFTVKHRAAREGRNPRTGETIQISASNVAGFKAGKALKDTIIDKPRP